MKFVDLFAGLGGFHVALRELGHECVFASEIDAKLIELYKINYNFEAHGDIRKINEKDIPKHDILCAGFPCQPFSKAGSQSGLRDIDRGTLFDEIARIVKYHKPKYLILENVANLVYHDKGNTWNHIIEILTKQLGYDIDYKVLSPHQFGIPQIRERIFIVGCRTGLRKFNFPENNVTQTHIKSILDVNPHDAIKLNQKELECLDIWQEFLDSIPENVKLPSFPIWSTEYNATYPFTNKAPFRHTIAELSKYKGMYGKSLAGVHKNDQLDILPRYAQAQQNKFPHWKIRYIQDNRKFLKMVKPNIKNIIRKIQKLPFSWQKFEWNCQGEERKLSNFIIQFRPSGIRVKRPNYSPAIVSSTRTQVPIIGWENRFMTIKEAARLQSLEDIIMPETPTAAFRALGNAVNATIIKNISQLLLST